ncbi:MAG TPA: ClpXP protease specificity-enhancing factor SspB [Paracoccaceae bacterium]|nr:ClpXP protease specificity-enhancing factor SspB [Paracoccaceae bacterium]
MSSAGNRLNYGQLMQKAMRRMMADVLSDVADNGLPGEHHFYISFETDHPGVDIADWMRERYPEEMTIVLQDWFDDLAVTPDRFSVTLNFSNAPQTLVIPFEAVRTFVDPSVRFGLKFDPHEAGAADLDALLPEDEDEDEGEETKAADSEPDETPPPRREPGASADVVSLDRFRKQ